MAARLAALVALTLVSYPLGLLLAYTWALPALNALPAYLLMVERLRAGDRRGAVASVLVWAAALAIFGTLAFALWPSSPENVVLGGRAYRDEMFAWICTGVGREGSPRLFLPQHLAHLGAFVILCLATASALSILMGAVLMNYMAFYVASLARAGVPGATVAFLGWQPWALCRVAAFCVLGAVLAEPLLSRLRAYRYEGIGSARPWLLAAGAGIAADMLLKSLLAPAWGPWLRAHLCP
ncbi:MAG TPA: hypothetical protein VFM88_00335 [Vicinamibacteria bacterium]|nr:hypothetical protein [Vicinamibacteria bacterium]